MARFRYWSLGFLRALLATCGVALILASCSSDDFDGDICKPQSHKGKPNDEKIDTSAIQAAIDACVGQGGRVTLSEGTWLTGMLTLGSDMEFHLADGAVLKLVADIALFPSVPDENGGSARYALHAPKARNLVISGPGKIDGAGPEFWDPGFYTLDIDRPTKPRPALTIAASDCENLTIDGMLLENLPAAAIGFDRCTSSSVIGTNIVNDPRSPDTDGIQVRDSANISISNVQIKTGGDAIALQSSTRAVDGVQVVDSALQSDDAAIKFGGASVIGVTNSSFRNIDITNSRYGIAIFAIDGGVHQNNMFETVRLSTGGRHARTYPIVIDVDRRLASTAWGGVENVMFKDMTIRTTGASLFAGNQSSRIKDIAFENVSLSLAGTPFDLGKTKSKPRADVGLRSQSGTEDYSGVNSHFVFANFDGVTLSDVTVDERSYVSNRGLVTMINGRNSAITDMIFEDGENAPRREGLILLYRSSRPKMDSVNAPTALTSSDINVVVQ